MSAFQPVQLFNCSTFNLSTVQLFQLFNAQNIELLVLYCIEKVEKLILMEVGKMNISRLKFIVVSSFDVQLIRLSCVTLRLFNVEDADLFCIHLAPQMGGILELRGFIIPCEAL